MTSSPNSPPSLRSALVALALLFVVPPLLAALLSPLVVRGLAYLTAILPERTLGLDFTLSKILSRLTMIFTATALWPVSRLLNIRTREDWGWPRLPDAGQRFGYAFAIGVLSLGAAYLLSTSIGALHFRPKTTSLTPLFLRWTRQLLAACLIGLIEETVFRAGLYGQFRRRLNLLPALGIASLIFAGVHFLRPQTPTHIVPTRWYAGFQLLPHLFDGVQPVYFWPTFVNLFLMALVLCLFFEHHRHIYAIAGLHAGWVWVQWVCLSLFDRNQGTWMWLYGRSRTISMTWLGTFLLAFFLVFAVIQQHRTLRKGRDGAP